MVVTAAVLSLQVLIILSIISVLFREVAEGK